MKTHQNGIWKTKQRYLITGWVLRKYSRVHNYEAKELYRTEVSNRLPHCHTNALLAVRCLRLRQKQKSWKMLFYLSVSVPPSGEKWNIWEWWSIFCQPNNIQCKSIIFYKLLKNVVFAFKPHLLTPLESKLIYYASQSVCKVPWKFNFSTNLRQNLPKVRFQGTF